MDVSTRSAEPLALMFRDDGSIPNNPRLPFLVYRGAIELAGKESPERTIESTFGANGWGDMWRNGIFPYVRGRLLPLGYESSPDAPERVGAFLKSEVELWTRVIKEAGIAPLD